MVWRQPAESFLVAISIERIDLGSSLAEGGLCSQWGCSVGLFALVFISRIEKVPNSLVGISIEGLRIQKSGIDRSNGERPVILNGMKKDEVSENVPFDRPRQPRRLK